MANGIKIGDVVQLKSGGPLMTVTGFKDGNSSVICTWFDKKDEPQARAFEVSSLEPYRPAVA